MLRSLERTTNKLSYKFKYKRDYVKANLDFFEEQLRITSEQADIAIDILGDDISTRGDSMAEVYDVDETEINVFQKFELKFLKWYVNLRYSKTADELVRAGRVKEELESMLKQMAMLKAWRVILE